MRSRRGRGSCRRTIARRPPRFLADRPAGVARRAGRRRSRAGIWNSLIKMLRQDRGCEDRLVDATISNPRADATSHKGACIARRRAFAGWLEQRIPACRSASSSRPRHRGESPQARALIDGLQGAGFVIANAGHLRALIANGRGARADRTETIQRRSQGHRPDPRQAAPFGRVDQQDQTLPPHRPALGNDRRLPKLRLARLRNGVEPLNEDAP